MPELEAGTQVVMMRHSASGTQMIKSATSSSCCPWTPQTRVAWAQACSGRTSWPQELMQCASSTATRLTDSTERSFSAIAAKLPVATFVRISGRGSGTTNDRLVVQVC